MRKKKVPPRLQTDFIEKVDKSMEEMIALGGLTNRYALRMWGVQMMCSGYYHEDHQKKKKKNVRLP